MSVADAEYWARRRVPRASSQAIEVGPPEPTFGRNLAAFDKVALQPRAGVLTPDRDLRTTVLGHELAIVEAVGDQVEILLDSGVRRGEDVVKALCLGARAVLIGAGLPVGARRRRRGRRPADPGGIPAEHRLDARDARLPVGR
jgi:isopentenyl diphosphate isomerase/L-lactate dehydrogenase-like FMN-dependent dehydrogenase